MEYLYNVSGQRVSTWNGSTRTAVSGKYYWDSTPVGFYTVGGSTYFEHQNWVGTERAVTSYNGGVIATIASLPFGDGRTVSGTDPDAYDFAGLDYDAESNLDHASYRQLATAQGRWLTPDPYNGSYNFSNPQTLNRYSYALNNPVSSIDPSGLDCVFFDGDGRPYLDGGEDDDHSVDDINPKQCGSDGGDWIDGFVSGYNFDSSSGLYTFYSSDANNVYQTTSYNPEDQEGYTGTTCSGDCAVGFSQSPNDSGLSVYLGSGYIRLVANAPNNAPDPMQPTPTYNKCNQQAIAAAGPLVPDGQSIATTAVTTAASWLFPGTTWFKLARGIVTGQFSRLIVKAAVYNANFEGCMSANGVVIPPQQY